MSVRTSDIKAALEKLYAAPEWAILFEVNEGIGAASGRRADAVAMSLWPSRGQFVYGMEIKISRSDWQRERAKPEKAEVIAAYCDFWTLVTAPGVVRDVQEIPSNWRWMEFDGKQFQRRQEGKRLDAIPVSRSFLAALLRSCGKVNQGLVDAAIKDSVNQARSEIETLVASEVARRAQRNTLAADMLEELETAMEIKIGQLTWKDEFHPKDVGRAIRALIKSGVLPVGEYSAPFSIAETMREIADRIDKTMADCGFDKPVRARR